MSDPARIAGCGIPPTHRLKFSPPGLKIVQKQSSRTPTECPDFGRSKNWRDLGREGAARCAWPVNCESGRPCPLSRLPNGRAARRMRRSHSLAFLPGMLLGIVWRFEFARVGHGRRVPLMMHSSFCISSREGFWPERVRKKAGRCAANSVSLRMWLGMRLASTAACSENLSQSSVPDLKRGRNAVFQVH